MAKQLSMASFHGCQCPGDMAVRMREVLARPLVGVCVSPALSLSYLALLAWGDFHARSCFLALLSRGKMGTTRSLC